MKQYAETIKLHPKLRMIIGGDEFVNCRRAERSQTVASTAAIVEFAEGAKFEAASATAGVIPEAPTKLAGGNLARQAYVSVFIEVHRDRRVDGSAGMAKDVESLKERIGKWMMPVEKIDKCLLSKRNFIAATVPVSELPTLASDESVAFIYPAEALELGVPPPVQNSSNSKNKKREKLQPTPRPVPGKHNGGKDVIIGIIDIHGFDFSHSEFIANGKSRFLSIWDQGGNVRPPPSSRRATAGFAPFDFGSELLKADFNDALADERKNKTKATENLPQSQQIESAHGTHVCSIAAGNSGVCPKADIAAVLLQVPPINNKVARRQTLSDSTRLLLAVEYLLEVAKQKKKPISINISLGTNGGAHDGSGGVSRWLDTLLAAAGRAITVSAGNAGQEAPTDESPNGWMMGRIHASGRIPASGLTVDLDWIVKGNKKKEDLSENELEIWYSPQDRFTIAVRPPGETDWIKVGPREYVDDKRLPSNTHISVYNELYNPINGCNYCAVYLSPHQEPNLTFGIKAGTWTIRLRGDEVRNGEFHCWIERDEPGKPGIGYPDRFKNIPSFFSEASNVDSHSINSLACGYRVISVANLDEQKQRIAADSSQGPTRDARLKPDIAAPGTRIVAANGFADKNNPWVMMSGTSMASPYVAGLVGLMLSKDSTLTSAQCSAILQRTSSPLPGSSYEWQNDAGFGAINAPAALAEAALANARTPKVI